MLKSVLRAGCAGMALASASAAAAQEPAMSPLPDNICVYRNDRPVWHFLPLEALPDDLEHVDILAGDIFKERSYLTERGGRATVIGSLDRDEGDQQADEFFDFLEDIVGRKSLPDRCIKDVIKQLENENGGFSETQREEVERALKQANENGALNQLFKNPADLPPSCRKSDADWIEGINQELVEFDDSQGRRPGASDVAQIAYGSPLNRDWHYVRVTLSQANLSFGRRFWKIFYPAVHSTISFDTPAGAKTATGITTDESDYSLDKRRVQRTLVRNQVILPVTPYIGGDFQLNVAILAVESYDYARQFLNFLDSITDSFGAKLLSEADPIFKIIDEGIKHLAGTDKEKQFLQAGVSLDLEKPRTGYWLLIWPNNDFLKAYADQSACGEPTPRSDRPPLAELVQNRSGGGSPFSISGKFRLARSSVGAGTDGLVLMARSKAKAGEQWEPFDNASWALVRMDAFKTNPNWRRIAGLFDARRTVIETMVSLYFPAFVVSTEKLEDAAASETPPEAAQPATGKTTASDSSSPEQTQKNGASGNISVEDKLKRDMSFYFNLIMNSPDLLDQDKYQLMQRELLTFQRYAHVLQASKDREALVQLAYERWRAERKKAYLCEIEDRFGKANANDEPACPAQQSNSGSDAPADAPDPGGDESSAPNELEPVSFESARRQQHADGIALVDQSALALMDAVHTFMMDHPIDARLMGYRTIGDINGPLIASVAMHPGGAAIRQQGLRFLADLLIASWPDYQENSDITAGLFEETDSGLIEPAQ